MILKKKYPSQDFIEDLKYNLISEFNFTFKAYYDYKNDFNEKIGSIKQKLNNIVSLNPEIDVENLDKESLEYIKKLVNKNVLLYL